MRFILESQWPGMPDSDKGFDMYRKEIAAYSGSHRLVFLTWKRIYEIIKSRSKFHLKEGYFLSKHWGGAQSFTFSKNILDTTASLKCPFSFGFLFILFKNGMFFILFLNKAKSSF